ncbi:unnamed protein product, partial [Rotaria sp. Silwood2]
MTSDGNMNSVVYGAVVPDGDWRWIIVFASFMIHFIIHGITYSMGDLFLRPMMHGLNKNRGSVATIFGILKAIMLATGIGFGLIYLPAIVSVSFYFESKRSFAMGIAVWGSGWGTLVFRITMSYIINAPLWFGYERDLRLEAVVIFICVIFAALMIPLSQEPSERSRTERKTREKAKQRGLKTGTTTNQNNEQQSELLPTNQESRISLQEVSVVSTESTAVVPVEQEYLLSDDKHRVSLSNFKKNDLYINNSTDETLSISRENVLKTMTIDLPVVVLRKDAIYQVSLHNIPLNNKDIDEYHCQMIKTSDMKNETITKVTEKSFLAKIVKQINFSLLKD